MPGYLTHQHPWRGLGETTQQKTGVHAVHSPVTPKSSPAFEADSCSQGA